MSHLTIVLLLFAGGLVVVFIVGRIFRASHWLKGRFDRKESIDWQSTREWQNEARRRMQAHRTPKPGEEEPPPKA